MMACRWHDEWQTYPVVELRCSEGQCCLSARIGPGNAHGLKAGTNKALVTLSAVANDITALPAAWIPNMRSLALLDLQANA